MNRTLVRRKYKFSKKGQLCIQQMRSAVLWCNRLQTIGYKQGQGIYCRSSMEYAVNIKYILMDA
eukprot:482938-Ditylum_brightwellii.AAC.1